LSAMARSDSSLKQQKHKTHCPNGHPIDHE
jgi:hypothetical protein